MLYTPTPYKYRRTRAHVHVHRRKSRFRSSLSSLRTFARLARPRAGTRPETPSKRGRARALLPAADGRASELTTLGRASGAPLMPIERARPRQEHPSAVERISGKVCAAVCSADDLARSPHAARARALARATYCIFLPPVSLCVLVVHHVNSQYLSGRRRVHFFSSVTTNKSTWCLSERGHRVGISFAIGVPVFLRCRLWPRARVAAWRSDGLLIA